MTLLVSDGGWTLSSGRSAPWSPFSAEITLSVDGGESGIALDGQDHQILALPGQRKILQWTNTLLGAKNRRSDKKARRREPDKDKLILNYATAVSIP